MFKANGVMGELLPDFQPRWRPMFTPELEGLAITPDSLYVHPSKQAWLAIGPYTYR